MSGNNSLPGSFTKNDGTVSELTKAYDTINDFMGSYVGTHMVAPCSQSVIVAVKRFE